MSRSRYSRQTLRSACLDYIHLAGLYDPFGSDIKELVRVLRGAPQEVVDQCLIDTDLAIEALAADRGVSKSEIKREFRDLKKSLPGRADLEGISADAAASKIVSSHARLRRQIDPEEPLLARLDERDTDTIFGGRGRPKPPGVRPQIFLMRPTRRYPERFRMGVDGYEVSISDHAFKARQNRQISIEEIADVLFDRHPVYYRNKKNRFVQEHLVVIAVPARRGWTIVTVYRN